MINFQNGWKYFAKGGGCGITLLSLNIYRETNGNVSDKIHLKLVVFNFGVDLSVAI
jgi:hypothetical protein